MLAHLGPKLALNEGELCSSREGCDGVVASGDVRWRDGAFCTRGATPAIPNLRIQQDFVDAKGVAMHPGCRNLKAGVSDETLNP